MRLPPSQEYEKLIQVLINFRKYYKYSNKRISKDYIKFTEDTLMEQMTSLWYLMSKSEQKEADIRYILYSKDTFFE